jgi:hypothetical protein
MGKFIPINLGLVRIMPGSFVTPAKIQTEIKQGRPSVQAGPAPLERKNSARNPFAWLILAITLLFG